MSRNRTRRNEGLDSRAERGRDVSEFRKIGTHLLVFAISLSSEVLVGTAAAADASSHFNMDETEGSRRKWWLSLKGSLDQEYHHADETLEN